MKMKNIKYILGSSLLACSLLLSSCSDYLDMLPDDQKTEQEVFSQYSSVNELVANAYDKTNGANRILTFFNHFSSAAVTDEAEGSTVEGNITNRFNNGDWSITDLPGSAGQYWWDLYEGIRKTNVILAGVAKYNTPDNPLGAGDLEKRIGETYFLRAYFHYLLLRMYGEAPYIDYVVDPNQAMDFKQISAHEMVEKISVDAQEAYKRVPASWNKSSADFGRVDQGACLGLIASARWIVATPLYNGAASYGYKGTRVFENEYSTYDANRWVAVRDAAKALLDFKFNGEPRYKLYTSYTNQDFKDDSGNDMNNSTVYTRLWKMFFDPEAYADEYVFFRPNEKDQGWFGDIFPPSKRGSSRLQPVQEQVDEYEYISPDGYGYPIYSDQAIKDGYDDGNPYMSVKRDPRFYRDIVFHGAPFRDGSNNKEIINTSTGSDRIGAFNATTTGYYLRKWLIESYNFSGSYKLTGAIWRLPEFMYMYAEAVNEISGPNQDIYDLVNKVRARSFMAPMPAACKTNKELMKEYIKRERRVEFFYENKRMFETRLYLEPNNETEVTREKEWLASGTDNTTRSQKYWAVYHKPYPRTQHMINGMRAVEDPNGKIEINGVKYRMERFCKETRVFETPKHYLFPIMQAELQKCPTLVQNPGW